MDQELRKRLLERKFSSIEYVEEFCDQHRRTLDALEQAIQWFYDHPPAEDWHQWHRAEWPETWEERAVANFRGMQAYLDNALVKAKQGDTVDIKSAAGDFTGIGRGLNDLGRAWWQYVPPELENRFSENLGDAIDRAGNVWFTIGNYWREGEILNERITGRVDENDLRRFLKPGEDPDQG